MVIKSRLIWLIQALLIRGGIGFSFYFLVQHKFTHLLIALVIVTLAKVSLEYRKKRVYHMVFTEDATEEDKEEEELVIIEKGPNYIKKACQYFVVSLGLVWSFGTIIYTDIKVETLFLVICLLSLAFLAQSWGIEKSKVSQKILMSLMLYVASALMIYPFVYETLTFYTVLPVILGGSIFYICLIYRWLLRGKQLQKQTYYKARYSFFLVSLIELSLFGCSMGLIGSILTPYSLCLFTPLALFISGVLLTVNIDTFNFVKDSLK